MNDYIKAFWKMYFDTLFDKYMRVFIYGVILMSVLVVMFKIGGV